MSRIVSIPSARHAKQVRRLRWVSPILSLAALLACAGMYQHSLGTSHVINGVRLAHAAVGGFDVARLDAAIRHAEQTYRKQTLTLTWSGRAVKVPLANLGVTIDRKQTKRRALAIGRSGQVLSDLVARFRAMIGGVEVPLVIDIDRDKPLTLLRSLQPDIERPARKARLDFANGRVVPARAGIRLDLYETLARIETALRRGQQRAAFAVIELGAKPDPRFANLDISHVLGQFRTVYSLADKDVDRAHNLKLGASQLDGRVLYPGETLSFNAVVGPRNKSQGYRTAPVISQGELVDGMAGGACQLSSTLFAASFFAGLELVSSRPHTMPSSYIKMGLDAAVSYPNTDLVLKNPYTFPVAIQFIVSRGEVVVTVRGQKRPWRRVTYERELKGTTPYKQIRREDPGIPRGHTVVAQRGVPGYRLERRRLLFKSGGKPSKVEKREIRYPPTTEIIKVGTGKPDPAYKPPAKRKRFGDVPPIFRIHR